MILVTWGVLGKVFLGAFGGCFFVFSLCVWGVLGCSFCVSVCVFFSFVLF